MAAATDAGGTATAGRLSLFWRAVRAAELLALAILLSRSFPHLPSAAAAASCAVRLAASLLLHPRSIFLLANAIVLLLLALSRCDISTSPSHSSSSDHDDAPDQLLSFAGPPLLLPPIAEAPAPAPKEDAVFEDKQAVHVKVRAPRGSWSEKIGGGSPGGSGRRRAASPELRLSESKNGRRRRSTSSAAPEEWGVEDEEEFRRKVDAFIAKQQTRFHREESLVLVAGDDASAIAGAVAAVK